MNLHNLTIKELKARAEVEGFGQGFLNMLAQDPRSGAQDLYRKLSRLKALQEKALKEYHEKTQYEVKYWNQGLKYVAGMDEAGRGPLAGPVVAAVVILDPLKPIFGIDDSKKLTPQRREELFEEIKEKALFWSVGQGSTLEIDTINILNATYLAMHRALLGLSRQPDHLLIDAVKLPEIEISQEPIIKGDSLSVSIGAASIVAKVTRDRIMTDLDKEAPEYGFIRHKGYASQEHIDTIKEKGLSPYHRVSFCKSFLGVK